jgi:hypothetical protein
MLLLSAVVLSSVPGVRSQQANEKARTEDDKPAFLVLPYLQLPTPTGIRIMWETNQKLPSRVEYGRTRDLKNAVDDRAPVMLHEVQLGDLETGATYYYRVRSGELLSDVYSFRTAPPPGTKHWRMAVYGDSRSNPATHQKVVEQIAKAGVDLIVHTGDIVLNGKNHDSWRKEFFEPLNPLGHSIPWVSTIGNHERDAENYFSYMALPGNERFFGFDYANAHIICLDSNGWIEKGRDSRQYEWLVNDLRRRRPTTWTFVAFHHPLFSAHLSRPINSLRWDWAPVFLDPENHVDGVLTGHDHFYAHNFRMGRLADKPEPGVLFLTTAGGGASLYKTRARDYIAKEKSVHHFTLFDFDGEQVNVSAIDITGRVIDRFVLTKQPTAWNEFCAYEVEELRRFLRLALTAAPAVHPGQKVTAPAGTEQPPSPQILDTRLRVPTRFEVPVSGRIVWQEASHWKMRRTEIPFHLQPGQALEIPIQAEIEPGDFPRTPGVTIAFEPGRFRNRFIDVYPIKLAGPVSIASGKVEHAPFVDGHLDDDCWASRANAAAASDYSLLGLPPQGGRKDRVRFLADKNWIYVGARLENQSAKAEVRTAANSSSSRLVLFGEHARLLISDGKEMHTFAVSPEQIFYATVGAKEDKDTAWKAAAASASGAWSVEMAIPRSLFPDARQLRVNFVHRRRQGMDTTDFELCPTYGLGGDPDLLPDWKPVEAPERFAQLELP